MFITQDAPLLVFGAGSIGERHIQVLQQLGYNNIYVFRQRNLPLRQVDPSTINIFTDIGLIDEIKPVAAFITSPTALHAQQTLLCIEKGIHVLVEKPLSHRVEDMAALREAATANNVLVQVGYMLRYHPAFVTLKSIISKKEFGKLIYFHTHWGEYLPHWHPWEDYKQSYAALKGLGGGAALTLSHDLDIVNWLTGDHPVAYNLFTQQSAELDIDVESAADFTCIYPSDLNGHVHLNFFQKVPLRTYLFVFEDAIIRYNYFDNQMIIQTPAEKSVIDYADFERNNMFRDQAQDFFNIINTNSVFTEISDKNIKDAEVIIKMCTKTNLQ